jgi:hypothetical protein
MLKQWQNMGLTTVNDASTVWMTKKIMKPMEMGVVGNQLVLGLKLGHLKHVGFRYV